VLRTKTPAAQCDSVTTMPIAEQPINQAPTRIALQHRTTRAIFMDSRYETATHPVQGAALAGCPGLDCETGALQGDLFRPRHGSSLPPVL
jgi:hypothetical protein